jgi:glutathione peroxidase
MNALMTQALQDGVSFTIIGFPCNQFLYQEPGSNRTEIMNLAKYVRPGNGYEPNFPWFGMMLVNGAQEWPLYTFLKDRCPPYQKELNDRNSMEYDPISSGDVVWNYEKYLVNPLGMVQRRFAPAVLVEDIYNEYILPNLHLYQ